MSVGDRIGWEDLFHFSGGHHLGFVLSHPHVPYDLRAISVSLGLSGVSFSIPVCSPPFRSVSFLLKFDIFLSSTECMFI